MTRAVDFDAFVRARDADLRRRLWRTCQRLGLDVTDVTQETYARLLAKYADIEDADELFACAVTIGRNICKDWAATAYRRAEEPTDDLAALDTASTVNVADEVEARITAAVALSGLRALPARQRRVVSLVAAGWKPREIAAHLRESSATVNSLAQRGRARLMKSLRDAGLTSLGIATLRRLRSALAPTPASLTLISIAVLTLAVPLIVIPTPSLAGPQSRGQVAEPPDNRQRLVAALSAQPGLAAASRSRSVVSPVDPSRSNEVAEPPSPSVVPPTRTCIGKTCVGGDDQTPGDELFLKPGIPIVGGIGQTQSFARVCPSMPDNPALGCRQHGHPEYVVDPTPGPTPP
jgi:RNA polymerase sigma factor (sigma-70 family)